jgi:hypothetical protein
LLVYELERTWSEGRDLDAGRKVLLAIRDAMPWGDLYFGTGYDDAAAERRAAQDYESIAEHHSYGEIFQVPTEPLAALLANPGAGGPIRRETIEAASNALWQIGIFNQLVRQKTDFNARHLAEFVDRDLPEARREVLANAAFSQSRMLHASGIGDAAWWAAVKDAFHANIKVLNQRWARRWFRWQLALAFVFVAATVVLAVVIGADRGDSRSKQVTTALRTDDPTRTLPGFIGCAFLTAPNPVALIRPRSILMACGDGNFFITNLRWSRWNASEAGGAGVGHQNDCTPDCARGHFHRYPVAIRLFRVVACKSRLPIFTRASYRFVGAKPPGVVRSSVEPFGCPLRSR